MACSKSKPGKPMKYKGMPMEKPVKGGKKPAKKK